MWSRGSPFVFTHVILPQVDAYTVGWYQTADLSSFSNETLLETQFNYQTNPLLYVMELLPLVVFFLRLTFLFRSRKCVALVYDPIMTLQSGILHIRALRLTHEFSEVYAKDPEVRRTLFFSLFFSFFFFKPHAPWAGSEHDCGPFCHF